MEWCIYNQQWEASLQLIGAVAGIWAVTSNWMEVDQWYKKILSSKQEFVHNRYLARAIQCAGAMVAYLDWDAAIMVLKQSLSIWQEIGDKKGIGATLYAIGDGYFCQGKPKEAIIMLEESLDISRQINNQGVIASLLRYLSGLYLCIDYQNNLEKAQELCDESLKIARQIGSKVLIAQCRATQGLLEMIKGNYIHAYKLLEESLTLLENVQIPMVSLAGYLDSMGLANFYIGNYPSARACYEKAIEYTNQIGARNLESLCNLSYLLSRSGEYDQAIFNLKEIFLKLEVDHDIGIAIIDGVLEQLPGVLLACSEPEKAAKLYAFTDKLRENLNLSLPPYIRPDYERDLAETRQQLGEDAFNALWEEGRSMSFEQAKECALEAKVRVNKVSEAKPAG